MESASGPIKDTAYKKARSLPDEGNVRLLKMVKELLATGDTELIEKITLEVEGCLKKIKP